MDDAEFFQEVLGLPPGAAHIIYIEHQGQGVKIVNELSADSMV